MHLTMLACAALLAATPGPPAAGPASPAAPQTAPAAAGPADEFPEAWYFFPRAQPEMAKLRALEGRPAPPLTVDRWVGAPQTLEGLRGRVVVVDFWGTWCRPCVEAIPKNREMVVDYLERDFQLVGVHSTIRGDAWNEDAAVRLDVNYPVAVDVDDATARAWHVAFWPTYAVIDPDGIVRAVGLKPRYVRPVVEKLLGTASAKRLAAKQPAAAPPASPGEGGVPVAWLEGTGGHRRQLAPLLEAGTPPFLESDTWLNSEPLRLEDLRGKVVLIDFWATWSMPCLQAVPGLNELQEEHAADGLVVIGVCAQRGVERMASTVAARGIRYAVCADDRGAMARRYKVDDFPDYYLVDRAGRLRVADCSNDEVEAAVRMLLAEPTPPE